MDKNEKDFIELLSSFLNSSNPNGTSFDWQELLNLSKINNVVGIIAHQIKLLPKSCCSNEKIKQEFNRYLAASIFKYDTKEEVVKIIKDIFNSNQIDFILVKGAVIKDYYPVPELRTSGDIDVIVREEQFEKVYDVFNNANCEILTYLPFVIEAQIDDVTVEIHKGADVFGNYFDNIFALAEKNGCEYYLDNYQQMLYVFLHLIKHLRSNGAGIRMLMDIDVCVRGINNFDEIKFLNMCKNAGVEQCGNAIFSLCKNWFDTPINSYYTLENEFVDLMAKGFLYNGTFGFEQKGYGGFYLSRASKDGKIGLKEQLYAFLRLMFPSLKILRTTFNYLDKYPFLLPFAYIHRFFIGVFKRGKHSLKTFDEIKNPDSSSKIVSMIQAELKIK